MRAPRLLKWDLDAIREALTFTLQRVDEMDFPGEATRLHRVAQFEEALQKVTTTQAVRYQRGRRKRAAEKRAAAERTT